MEHHISLAPEILTLIGPLPVTNTMIVTWMTTLILAALAYLSTINLKMVPSGLQNVFEIVIDGIYSMTENLTHSKQKANAFFPIIATFFFFILTANWLGLLPGFATIGFYQEIDNHEVFVPILRSANTDLNTTLALAIVSVVATHFFAIKYLGLFEYLKKWFSLNPIFLFVGLLELIGELTKVASLSLRLFGNIFAGEVVLATISGLLAFIAPLPFYILEIVVGVVQAAVFMMLTLVFMVLLSEKHTGSEH